MNHSTAAGIVYFVSVNPTSGYLSAGSNMINHGLSIDGKVGVVNLEIMDLSATVLSAWAWPTFVLFLLANLRGGWLVTVWLEPPHDYKYLNKDDGDIFNQRRKAMARMMKAEGRASGGATSTPLVERSRDGVAGF